jgi:spore germination protein KB
MIKEGKFGESEAIWLVTITMISKVFFSSPATLTSLVGNATWYTTLISSAVAFLGFYFIYCLLNRFPQNDLTEIFDIALGKIGGFIFSLILMCFFIILTAFRISESTAFLKVYVIPESPNWFSSGIFIVCIYIFSVLGLETMARFSKAVIYTLLSGLIFVLVLSMQNFDVNNLFPVFGYGIDKIAANGLARSSVYGEVIVFAVFAKSFQGVKYIKREGFISLIVATLVISGCLLAYALTFPYYVAQEITAPIYEMSILISYGRFIQRVEALFLYVWIISTFLSTTVTFYSFVWIFCKAFKISDKRPVILGGCLIVYAASLIHKNIISIIYDYIRYARNFGSIPVFVLPLIVLIVAMIRKKGVKTNA